MQRRCLIWILSMMVALFLATTVASASPVLVKEGMRGPVVQRVQELLIWYGYLEGEPDGICGSKTVDAIRRYQKASGLDEDGICGPGTYRALSGSDTYEDLNAPAPSSDSGSYAAASSYDAYDMASRGDMRSLFVSATGYSAYDPGNSPYTAMGTPVRYGVIAVDPSVIPLGSRVYIPGYGVAVAEDTGGAIQGNRIDVAFDSHEQALEFGRQNFEVYLMD